MKKRRLSWIITLALALIVLTFPTDVSAHPGRTDSNGGHTNNSTGEYHYHHGYSEHDHYDMDGDGDVDCPYDFEEMPGVGSGSSTSNNGSSRDRYTVDQSVSTISVADKQNKEECKVPLWVYFLMAGQAILIICLCFTNKWKKDEIQQRELNYTQSIEKERKLAIDQEKVYTSQIEEIKRKLGSIEESHSAELAKYQEQLRMDLMEINSLLAQKNGKDYICNLCGVPNGDDVGDDNLPRKIDGTNHKWGEKYTYYIALDPHGLIYHSASCAHRGCMSINAYSVFLYESYIPCKHCRPKLPDLSWYIRYRRIFELARKYTSTREGEFSHAKSASQTFPSERFCGTFVKNKHRPGTPTPKR